MAEGFKIADGYVEVGAEADRNQIRGVAGLVADDVEKVGRRRRGGFFAALFTPDARILSALRTGVPAALSSPLGLAAITLGATFAAAFVAAFLSSLALAGLGAAFIALGAFALRENEKIKKAFGETAKTIGEGMRDAAKPLVPAFVGALQIISDVFTNQVQPLIKEIFTGLEPVIKPLTRAVGEAIVNFLEIIADPKVIKPLADFMIAMAEELPRLGTMLGEFFRKLAEHGPQIEQAFKGVITVLENLTEFVTGLLIVFTDIFNAIMSPIESFTAFVKTRWFNLKSATKGLVSSMSQNFGTMFGNIKNPFKKGTVSAKTLLAGLKPHAKNTINNVQSTLNRVIGIIGKPFGLGTNEAKQRFRSILGPVKSVVSGIGNVLKRIVGFITAPFRQGTNKTLAQMRALPGKISGAIGNLSNLLYNKGASVVQGLINGISSKLGALGDKVGELAGKIGDFLPGSPVKLGPLRVLNNLATNPGAKIVDMLNSGIELRAKDFQGAAFAGLAQPAPNVAFNPSVSSGPVHVYIDGKELEPRMVHVLKEENVKTRRAVTSGGRRTP